MDEANRKMTDAINKMVEDIDRNCLRRMQIDMFKCSARCCEDMNSSVHQVQQCVTRCNAPAEQANQALQAEIQAFQNRLQRCAMDCQDQAKDILGAKPGDKERRNAEAHMEKCTMACVDSHISLIPGVYKRITDSVNF